MAADTVAAVLEREHQAIDAGIETFVSAPGGKPDPKPLTRAMAALRRHIYLEEEFLFPPLRAAGLIAPVFVMVREHGEMWRLLDVLDDELGSGAVPESVAGLVHDLQDQLHAHNPKEEQILYPQADQALGALATAELGALLDLGRLPDGWVCQAVR
jgi:regulator of cell morphogenesis and NO signaling